MNVNFSYNRSEEQGDHSGRGADSEDPDGSETPFVGNHQVKVVRNLKRLR